MNITKPLVALLIILSFLSCESQKTQRVIEDEFVKKYGPKNLNTYGFTLATDSKVPEVHQLMSDLQQNFYFYGDKEEYDKKGKKITQLDPNYPSGFLMSSFYIDDPEEYKSMVTKAYELSKNSKMKSERDIMQAEYSLLVEDNYPKAQEYFQKVVDVYPESPEAVWSLGMAYYYGNELDKALECYKKSTELLPNLPKGYEFMSVIYYTKKDFKKALEYLEKAKKYGANPKNDVYFAEYEPLVYYKNKMYKKTLNHINTLYTYGQRFENSESLKKTYKVAETKLDSINSSKL